MKQLKRILYAEDEIDIQTVVEAVVESLSDFELKICENGEKLLEEVDDFNPDLIILDVMMPKMDGPKTFEELKKNSSTEDVPVIFMTAKAQVQEVQSYIKQGALGVITKPFEPMTLCDSIQLLWDSQF